MTRQNRRRRAWVAGPSPRLIGGRFGGVVSIGLPPRPSGCRPPPRSVGAAGGATVGMLFVTPLRAWGVCSFDGRPARPSLGMAGNALGDWGTWWEAPSRGGTFVLRVFLLRLFLSAWGRGHVAGLDTRAVSGEAPEQS